jgi:hypothetical protein
MGSQADALHCSRIIDEVDEAEANDWEETNREERHWMRVARDLARALMSELGYVKGG